jgi:ligand-binding sensor domain-containing protein
MDNSKPYVDMKKFVATTIFLHFIGISCSFAQTFLEVGHLPLQNFTPQDYNAFRQNQGITEDNRGLIYVANKWGVLEYDGSEWKMLEGFKDDAEPFDLVTDATGHVWVAAKDEIGYFLPDSAGTLRYRSMVKELSILTQEIGQLKKVDKIADTLYFLELNKIVTFNEKTGFGIFASEDTILQQIVVDGQLIVQLKNKGLCRIVNKIFVPISNSDVFRNENLVSMIKHSASTYWAIMQSGKVYKFDLNKLQTTGPTVVATSLDNFLFGDVLDAVPAGKGRIALSIRGKGVLLLNRQGEIVQIVNKSAGLKDGTVNRLYVDSRNLLWMATMDGIAVAVENSPLSSKSEEDNLEGTIESIARFRDKLYVASHVGLYVLGADVAKSAQLETLKPPFTKIPNFELACYALHPIEDNELLIVGHDGLYTYTEGQVVKKIYNDHEVIYTIKTSAQYPGLVFLGVQGGIVVLEKLGNNWEKKGLLELEYKVLSMEFQNDKVWFSVIGEALVGFTAFRGDAFDQPTYFTEEQGVPKCDNALFLYKDDVFLGTAFGLRMYNPTSKSFELSNRLGDRFADTAINIIRISRDYQDRVWIFCAKGGKGESFGYVSKNPQGKFVWNENFFRSVARENILAIYHDRNQVTWFGGGGGVHRFDFNQIEDVSLQHPVLVRKSLFGNRIYFNGTFVDSDGLIQIKQTEAFRPELKYEQNSFQISFSSIHSELGTTLKYSWKLVGIDDNWTLPAKTSVVNYSNLKAGKYVFMVKSVDEYGVESEVSEFKFTILPPWYETIGFYLAQTAFLLSLIIVSYVTNRNPKVSRVSSVLTLITIITIFEILVTLIEPFLDNYSGGVPVFKLSMNVVLALSLNPLEGITRNLLAPKKASKSN